MLLSLSVACGGAAPEAEHAEPDVAPEPQYARRQPDGSIAIAVDPQSRDPESWYCMEGVVIGNPSERQPVCMKGDGACHLSQAFQEAWGLEHDMPAVWKQCHRVDRVACTGSPERCYPTLDDCQQLGPDPAACAWR